jgi:hypothetical protein
MTFNQEIDLSLRPGTPHIQPWKTGQYRDVLLDCILRVFYHILMSKTNYPRCILRDQERISLTI